MKKNRPYKISKKAMAQILAKTERESRKTDKQIAQVVFKLDGLVDYLAILLMEPRAAEAILNLAIQTCELAQHIVEYADQVQVEVWEFARRQSLWPMLYSPIPEIFEKNLLQIKELPLGEKTLWRPVNSRKPYSLKGLANSTVADTINEIIGDFVLNDRSPPKYVPFEKVWAKIDRKFKAISSTGFTLESSDLRSLGIAFAEGKRDTCPEGSRSYESNVRDGIKQRLRGAHKMLVKAKSVKAKSQ